MAGRQGGGEGCADAFGESERNESALTDAFLLHTKYLGAVITFEYGELYNNTVDNGRGDGGTRRPSVGAGDAKARGSFCVVALIKKEVGDSPTEEQLQEAMAAILGSLPARVWECTTIPRRMDT